MVFSIAAAVAAAVLVRANMDSLFRSVLDQAEAGTAVVFSEDAESEGESVLGLDVVHRISAAPGIARNGAFTSASPELLSSTLFWPPAGEPSYAAIRAVDDAAFTVHAKVRLAQGAALVRGERRVIAGSKLVARYPSLAVGQEVQIGRHMWPIVGVFDAAGTAYESELWVDRSAFMAESGMERVSVVVAKLDASPDALPQLQRAMEQIRDPKVSALSGDAFLHRSLGTFVGYQGSTAIVVALLFFGSLFACSSAMYTAVLSRKRELATLMAIGFTRTRVAVLLVFESTILAILGGSLGLAVALAFHGRVTYADDLSYVLVLSRDVLMGGVLMAIGVGIIGGLAALVQSRQMDVLESLRG